MKKIIIFGSSGRLGSYLAKYLKKDNLIFPIGYKKDNSYKINLLKELEVDKVINKINPDIIINCAGATNVDKCINNYNYGYLGNVLIPHNIVKALKNNENKIHLIHFSTDQVYNNRNKKKNLEKDINLSNNYSKTKFYGEKEVKKIRNYTIIRANFFGQLISNKFQSFSDLIINNLKNIKKIKMASNIFYNPIHVTFLLEYLKLIIKKNIRGTYNIGSKNIISKYEFAKMLAIFYHLDTKLIIEYKSNYNKDKRPLNTSVNNKKFENKIKTNMPTLDKIFYPI